MIEIYKNIRDEVKRTAQIGWDFAMLQSDTIKTVELLNEITNYYRNIYTQEEIEFLQFYFKMKMEMMIE